MSYVKLGAALMPQQLGAVLTPQQLGAIDLRLATAGSPVPPAIALPTGADPSAVEWVKVPADKPTDYGYGQQGYYWRCKATGLPMSSTGRCVANVTVTESPLEKLKAECFARGYPAQICSQARTGDTITDLARRAQDYARRTTTEHRPSQLAAQCASAGIPPQLVDGCVSSLLDGEQLADIVKQFERLSDKELAALGIRSPEQIAAEQAAIQQQQAAAARNRRLLLWGGVAAAGAVGLAYLSRKRHSR